jgi:hypothetical protein
MRTDTNAVTAVMPTYVSYKYFIQIVFGKKSNQPVNYFNCFIKNSWFV